MVIVECVDSKVRCNLSAGDVDQCTLVATVVAGKLFLYFSPRDRIEALRILYKRQSSACVILHAQQRPREDIVNTAGHLAERLHD
jgi:hypothetical protein